MYFLIMSHGQIANMDNVTLVPESRQVWPCGPLLPAQLVVPLDCLLRSYFHGLRFLFVYLFLCEANYCSLFGQSVY